MALEKSRIVVLRTPDANSFDSLVPEEGFCLLVDLTLAALFWFFPG